MDKLDKLIEQYLDSTAIHGESMLNNYKLSNHHYAIKTKCFCKIKEFGAEGFERLMQLLHHENAHVRVETAYFILSYKPNEALKVLRKNCKEPRGVGSNAKMIISEWKKGNLKFPELKDGKIIYV